MAGQIQVTLTETKKTQIEFTGIYINLEGTSGIDTLLFQFSTDPNFGDYDYYTFASTSSTSMMVRWDGCSVDGLDPNTTYYWRAYPTATPTASTPSCDGSFTTLRAIVISGGSVSPNSIVLGNSTSISWQYSGDMGATGSWNFMRTDTDQYVNPTRIAQYDQDQSSPITFTPSQTGSWYIWVWHFSKDGDEEMTSNIYRIGTFTVTQAQTHIARIWTGNGWKNAVPRIWHNGGWKEADEHIFD